MSENKYLEICLQQISRKMGWADHEHWTHFHFTKLSDQLLGATGISVSFDTLKRLAGKKKMSTEYNPRAETKEALARFLNYKGWDDFIAQCDASRLEEQGISNDGKINRPTGQEKSYKKLILITVTLLIVLGSIAGVVWQNRYAFAHGNLYVQSRTGDGPHTSLLYYTVSGLLFNSVYLDWGYEKKYITFVDKQPVKLLQKRGAINQCYFIPGWYIIKLRYGDRILDTTHVHITTANQWRPYVMLPEKNDIMLPILPQGSENEFIFNKPYVESQGFKESESYWTELRMIKETGLGANQFEWTADIKNPEKDAIICKDVVAEVQLVRSMIRIHFTQPGCTQFSEIRLPGKQLNGRSDNLSFLGVNFSDYKHLKIKSINSKITFYLDDAVIYESAIQSSESIQGFVLKFKGCGSAKNISFSEGN